MVTVLTLLVVEVPVTRRGVTEGKRVLAVGTTLHCFWNISMGFSVPGDKFDNSSRNLQCL